MKEQRKWRRLGRISLAFPLVGLGLLLLFIRFHNDPGDWHGIGKVVVGFGAFTLMSLIGGILGIVALAREFSVSGLVSLVIAVATLLVYGHILTQ